MNRWTLLWALPLLVGFTSRATAQQVYRWTDEKGRVHFSNVGPGAGEAKPSEGESAPAEPSARKAESPPGSVLDLTEQPGAEKAEKKEAVKEKEKRSPYADLSEDVFSARVSRQRNALKRELSDSKRHVRDLDEKIATVRQERQQAVSAALSTLQGMYLPADSPSEKEIDLKKDRETTEKRIEAIRKEYAELRDEAVKRFGHQPDWWLPIE